MIGDNGSWKNKCMDDTKGSIKHNNENKKRDQERINKKRKSEVECTNKRGNEYSRQKGLKSRT